VTNDSHITASELFDTVTGSFTRNFDPQFGEISARDHDEAHVGDQMDRIAHDVVHVAGRRNVIGQSRDRNTAITLVEFLPHTKKSDKEVVLEAFVEYF